jgi:hypothetical protein
MNYKKQHFISYGDDRPTSVSRIKKQAESFNIFSTIDIYYNKTVMDEEFRNRFSETLKYRRLGGYAIWKSYLINKKLKEIEDGEFIIYCDAGCELNNKGMKRYYEYLEMLKETEYGMISFPIEWNKERMPPPNKGYTDKAWTIKQLFDYFNIDINSNIGSTPQIASGILVLKKCANTIKIFEEYEKVLEYDQRLTTDYYNKIGQADFFVENRHDQSILSLLRKKYGSVMLDRDETFFFFSTKENENIPQSQYKNVIEKYKYPFWATRDKFGVTTA